MRKLETDIKEIICRQSLTLSFKGGEGTGSTDSARTDKIQHDSFSQVLGKRILPFAPLFEPKFPSSISLVMQMTHWAFTMTTEKTGQ